MILGAAPVPPLNPSSVMKSAPPLTIPTAIGAELWTAAILPVSVAANQAKAQSSVFSEM